MKKRFSIGKRALALALSAVMCVGMLQITAFAETTTVTEGPTTDTVSTGDENNGSSTTTTTTVETTVKTETKTEEPVKPDPATTQGESVKTGSTTGSNVLEDKSETTVKDLSFEASGTIDLKDGGGKGTVEHKVTAEDIAKELGWTCKDSSNGPELEGDNKVVSSKTEVKNENGVYSVESTKTTTETNYGEKKVVNSTEISKEETTSESKKPGIPTDPTPVGEPTEEVKLPERPATGTTQHEDGTSTVVSVEDVTDENNVTTGYIVITEERDAEGNVTSTRTENVSGTQKVEKTESVVVDETTNTKTTETKTKVEEVLEDKVITTTETVRNEVAVCEDENKLSADIKIDLAEDDQGDGIGQKVALGKEDVVSADVSIKQTSGSSNEVTADIKFNLEIKQGAKPEDLEVTVIQYTGEQDQWGTPVYKKLGLATVTGGNDGKTGTISFSGLDLATGQAQKITFDISYVGNGSGGGDETFAGLVINMEVSNIQTIGAAAKHTEATKKKEDVTTTNYEREDVTVETESITTVTTTTTTKTVTTDTEYRSWSTTTPTTPTTPTGDNDDDDTVVVPDTNVPLVEEPVIDVSEEEVPLAEEPVVDIPDEEVPLAEEVVIPDDDVPLANVPKTGDISTLWYLTTLLSACGLAFLGLRKKDRS